MSNRSPRYPAIALPDAIELAMKLFDKEGRAPVAEEVAAKHMGYSSLNGASMKVLSALRKYGLIEDVKGGVKLSQDAISLAAHRGNPNHPDRLKAVQRSATRVELFANLLQEFGPTASESNLASQLIVRGFSRDGATRAARSYRATMELLGAIAAKSDERNKTPKSATDNGGTPHHGEQASGQDVKVGDLVQIEIGGAFQFEEPKRVRAIQLHQGKPWIFVDGHDAGAPIDQVVVEASSAGSDEVTKTSDVGQSQSNTVKIREEKFALTEGDVVIRFPATLSPESVVDLEDYLKIFLKKAAREAGKTAREPS